MAYAFTYAAPLAPSSPSAATKVTQLVVAVVFSWESRMVRKGCRGADSDSGIDHTESTSQSLTQKGTVTLTTKRDQMTLMIYHLLLYTVRARTVFFTKKGWSNRTAISKSSCYVENFISYSMKNSLLILHGKFPFIPYWKFSNHTP